MSLLLLFQGADPGTPPEATFSGAATLTATGTAEVFAAVSFNAEADFNASGLQVATAAVSFSASSSFTLAPTIVVEWASVEFKAKARFSVVTRIEGDQWRLVAVALDQTPAAEIENAQVTAVVDDLNGEGAIEFSLPVLDPKAAHLPPLQEVQVWKGDTMLKQGPVFRPQANSRSLQYTGAGLEWYFIRRHFGKADRTNYVPNGDFEDGMANWRPAAAYYSPDQTPPDTEIVTFPTMTGRRALRMAQQTTGHDTFVDTGFQWIVDADNPDGDRWTAVGYIYIPDDGSFQGKATEGRGLMLERFSTTELHPDPVLAALGYARSIEHVFARLDEDTPRGQWFKMEAALTTPPKAGEAEGVRVTLYCPNGVCYWDRISLTRDEATRFYGVDQAQIAEGIVQHLQDPDYDKTDLNIGTNCQPTGVIRNKVYLHSEHENGKGALDGLTDVDDGLDYSVEVTPTTRTFTTHYPRKGVDHLDLVLEYGKNVEDFNWAFDGAVAANQVIALGSGDGSAREEGVAVDLTALQGVSLEEVWVAVEGEDIAGLDNRAADRLQVVKNPVILELFLKDTTLAGILRTGDRVRARVARNVIQVDAIVRVVRVAISPAADKMSVVVNTYYGDDGA